MHSKQMKAVCDALNVTEEQLKSKSRKRELVDARKVYVKLIIETDSRATLVSIGKSINRDHASIIHYKKLDYEFKTKEMYEKYISAYTQLCPAITEKEYFDAIIKGLIQLIKNKTETMKKLVTVIIAVILLSGCAMQKPTYKKGQDMNEYYKKVQKYYQKQQK